MQTRVSYNQLGDCCFKRENDPEARDEDSIARRYISGRDLWKNIACYFICVLQNAATENRQNQGLNIA